MPASDNLENVPTSSAPISIDEETCRRFQLAVELAGRKWAAAILLAAARGAERFSEIRVLVDGISDRVLSARLRELGRDGLIDRVVITSMPVQVRYRLTASGRDLIAVLQPLVGWTIRWEVKGTSVL